MKKSFQHKCNWILEVPKKGWSIGRCRWCSRVRAFDNDPDYDVQGKVRVPDKNLPNQGERDALREAGIPISRKKWSEQEINFIKASVRKIGVTATARKYNMPKQTVSLWTRGSTPLKYRADMYTTDFKMEVAKDAEASNNNYTTAKKYGVTRGSVQRWRKQYLTSQGK